MTALGLGEVVAGRFVVEGAPLGHGQTATVYPAWDELAGRPVALEVLHSHLLREPAALAALKAEAEAARRVRHPHLLVVEGLWSHQGHWFLVTERLDGVRLPDQGVAPLTAASTVALGLEVAEALAFLHEEGHVHGDVRPGRVLLTDRGAVLLGFGQRGARGPWASLPGQTAPEVELGGPAGPPADLYGLGIVLHQALTGRLPWRGPTPWAVLGAQRAAPPRPPPGPAGIAWLIRELLQPEADRRPPSAEAVVRALRQLREDPDRRVSFDNWLAPWRGTWAVHGTDPATGAPALVLAGLGRRRARALVRRLRVQGWEVRADREGLGLRDFAWITAFAFLVGLVLPLIGLPIGALLAASWRSQGARPRLREALPRVQAPVPPREVPGGTEHAAFAGLMLLVAAGLLVVWPELAVIPGVLFLFVLVDAWRIRRRDRTPRVTHGRLATVLAETRHLLERRPLDLDRQLTLQGELEALEADWQGGQIEAQRAVERAEEVLERALADTSPPDEGPGPVVTALRRTWGEGTGRSDSG